MKLIIEVDLERPAVKSYAHSDRNYNASYVIHAVGQSIRALMYGGKVHVVGHDESVIGTARVED